jgi:hypothetical protein
MLFVVLRAKHTNKLLKNSLRFENDCLDEGEMEMLRSLLKHKELKHCSRSPLHIFTLTNFPPPH